MAVNFYFLNCNFKNFDGKLMDVTFFFLLKPYFYASKKIILIMKEKERVL